MKKLFTLFLFITFALTSRAQSFVWAKAFRISNSGDGSRGRAIAVDKNSNVFTTGYFEGDVDFNPGQGVFNLSSFVSSAYISKLDAQGNFLWAKMIKGTNVSDGVNTRGISVDNSGSVYVIGTFTDTLDFDPDTSVFNMISFNGSIDIFILKLDSSGRFVWAKQLGGNSPDYGTSIYVDAQKNVYTTGDYRSINCDFDPGPGTYNLSASGSASEIFVSKLDSSGNFIWAKRMGGSNLDNGNAITVDAKGNVYTTGFFKGTADFNPGLGIANLTSGTYMGTVGSDIFVSKLDASGNYVWAKQFGAAEDGEEGRSIAVDELGYVYSTGIFIGTCDFDPSVATYNFTYNAGFTSTYISKLDSSGNFVWAAQLGTGGAQATAITLDGIGNVYTIGNISGNGDFDPGSGVHNLTAAGYDLFISKLDTAGNFVSAKQVDASPSSTIVADTSGNLLITGFFGVIADFDPDAGVYNMFGGNINGYAYVLKLGNCVPTSSTITRAACGSYTSPSGHTWTISGTYVDTIQNLATCDSIITINLTIKQSNTGFIAATICQGHSYFFNGVNRTVAGTYLDTLINSAGCDSFLTLQITIVNQPNGSTLNTAICSGSSFAFNGRNLTIAGTYYDTLTNVAGCDSLITLHLSFNSVLSSSFNQSICVGSSYFYNGQNLIQSGSYADTIHTSAGCDSIVTLHLQVDSNLHANLNASICQGDSYFFKGQNLSFPGIYSDTSSTASGCINITTLNLSVNQLPIAALTVSADTVCSNGFPVNIDGSPLGGTFSGTGVNIDYFDPATAIVGANQITYTYTDNNGCADSAVKAIVVVICNGINESTIPTSHFNIYPNPASESAIISVDESLIGSALTITDITGREVLHSAVQIQNPKFEIQNLSSGVYFVTIANEKGKMTKKLVKQ